MKIACIVSEHKSLMDLSQMMSQDSRVCGMRNLYNNLKNHVNVTQQHLPRNIRSNIWPNIWALWSSPADTQNYSRHHTSFNCIRHVHPHAVPRCEISSDCEAPQTEDSALLRRGTGLECLGTEHSKNSATKSNLQHCDLSRVLWVGILPVSSARVL